MSNLFYYIVPLFKIFYIYGKKMYNLLSSKVAAKWTKACTHTVNIGKSFEKTT